jgi:hypothetical protein
MTAVIARRAKPDEAIQKAWIASSGVAPLAVLAMTGRANGAG